MDPESPTPAPPGPGASPWWLSARARLVLLGAIFVAVAGYAVLSHTSRPSQQRIAWCQRPTGTPSLVTSRSMLTSLARGGGFQSVIAAGSRDRRGYQGPAVAWTDAEPLPIDATTMGPGYEIRWSSSNHDANEADVFVFPTAQDAEIYVQRAASTMCRAAASVRTLSQPRGARVLTWLNPKGYRQTDVFFARGREAYRIGSVPASAPPSSTAEIPPLQAQSLACGLKVASCPGIS